MSRRANTDPADLSQLPIDRGSAVPLYLQVELALRAAIETGAFAPGDRIPNEMELADDLGLSRPTVRRAIDDLVHAGLVTRRRGIGTHVASREVRRKVELTSLFDDLVAAGRSPTTTVLDLDHERVDTRAALHLGCDAHDPVIFVERLRSADGLPLAVMRNWLPKSFGRIDEPVLRRNGLYSLMRERGQRPAAARQRIGARAALLREADMLDIPRGAPLLTMQRTAYDGTGRVIEYGDHVYRADAYAVEVTVHDH